MTEVVFVMSVDASERNDGSDRVASAPCPTGALLITGTRWRHVAQGHARQGSNIDAYLHRRCAREDIDLANRWRGVGVPASFGQRAMAHRSPRPLPARWRPVLLQAVGRAVSKIWRATTSRPRVVGNAHGGYNALDESR